VSKAVFEDPGLAEFVVERGGLLSISPQEFLEGCGPDCGCHAVEKKKEAKDGEAGEEAGAAEQDENSRPPTRT
jgi:hypothetical protein